jgi:hypothetical protein
MRATYDQFLWTLLVIRSFGRTEPPELFDQPKLVGKTCLHGRVDTWKPSITRLSRVLQRWLLSGRLAGLFLGSTTPYLPACGTSAASPRGIFLPVWPILRQQLIMFPLRLVLVTWCMESPYQSSRCRRSNSKEV